MQSNLVNYFHFRSGNESGREVLQKYFQNLAIMFNFVAGQTCQMLITLQKTQVLEKYFYFHLKCRVLHLNTVDLVHGTL